jgi:FixJ family two-component response regulator
MQHGRVRCAGRDQALRDRGSGGAALLLVAQGMSNDQIADRMTISPLTANAHSNAATTKLHAATESDSLCPPTNPAW